MKYKHYRKIQTTRSNLYNNLYTEIVNKPRREIQFFFIIFKYIYRFLQPPLYNNNTYKKTTAIQQQRQDKHSTLFSVLYNDYYYT